MDEREMVCKEIAKNIKFVANQVGVKPQTIWKSYMREDQKADFKWCEIKKIFVNQSSVLFRKGYMKLIDANKEIAFLRDWQKELDKDSNK